MNLTNDRNLQIQLHLLSGLFNEDGSMQITTSSELSVDVSTAATLVNIPITCLEGIWIKAKKLMETDGAIVPAPGQLPEARMVLSYSGKPPHMVTPKKNGDFSCDSSCPNWKSLSAPILLLWLKQMVSFRVFYQQRRRKCLV